MTDVPKAEWDVKIERPGRDHLVKIWNVGDASAIRLRPRGEGCTFDYVHVPRLEPGEGCEYLVRVEDGQDKMNAARMRISYLTASTRRRKQKTLVVKIVNEEHRTERPDRLDAKL